MTSPTPSPSVSKSASPSFNELLPEFHSGSSPLLISIPHAGIRLPGGMAERLSEAARALPDTDWFVDRLYDFALEQGASMLAATASRLLVDLNRPMDDQPLYTGQETRLMTGVLPMQCFSGAAVYLPGAEPTKSETVERLQHYWQPYHQRLGQCLQEIRSQHGFAIVLDAHSIRSELPLLFDGRLADLNLGSNNGASAAADLIRLSADCLRNSQYSLVVDGRFKGGYITRHYGQPDQQTHALQLEMAQSAYMDEESAQWNASRATPLQRYLQRLVRALSQWTPA